jgi:hypothetical protein
VIFFENRRTSKNRNLKTGKNRKNQEKTGKNRKKQEKPRKKQEKPRKKQEKTGKKIVARNESKISNHNDKIREENKIKGKKRYCSSSLRWYWTGFFGILRFAMETVACINKKTFASCLRKHASAKLGMHAFTIASSF